MSLALYTTNDLLNELGSRFDHYIFSGVMERTKDDIDCTKEWSGHDLLLLGMAQELILDINKEVKSQ